MSSPLKRKFDGSGFPKNDHVEKPRSSEPTGMSDQRLMVTAFNEAGRIIADYLEPGPRNADKTIQQLISILDRQDLAAAMTLLENGHGLRVAK
jgi:hypothetical protein